MTMNDQDDKDTSETSTPTFSGTSILPIKGSQTSIDGGAIYEGEVIWFGGSKKMTGERSSTKGYGFISWFKNGVQQRDAFVHFSDIVAQPGTTYRTLKKGQHVSFQLGTNHSGELKCINVQVIGEATKTP